MKAPPKSTLLRSIKIFGAGSRVLKEELSSYVKSKISESHLIANLKDKARTEQIRILTEAFGQLKGSAMKFGQMLSLDAQDLLPPEALEILSQLQNKAVAVDSQLLFQQAKDDLGLDKFNQLHLDRVAIASASIGQVFKGEIDGQTVACKIQYPGIAETIDSDIEVLKLISNGLGVAFGKKMNLDNVFEELNLVLKNEADYTAEAKHLKQYTQMLSADPRFVVPQILDEYSSEKVLTMTFEGGMHLRDWIANQPPLEQRQIVGERILDLFCKEYFENGLVQTDPNLANFLIRPEDLKIVLLDFGAVLSYPEQFRNDYRKLLKQILSGKSDEIIQFCIEYKFLDPRESGEANQSFVDMLNLAIYPFREENQPFDFADKDYASMIRRAVLAFTNAAKYTPPPRELIFLHRKLGGIFNILKMMGLKMDLTPYRKTMIQS